MNTAKEPAAPCRRSAPVFQVRLAAARSARRSAITWPVNRSPLWVVAAAATAYLGLAPRAVAQRLDVEAYAGQPFGVGRVTIAVATNQPVVPLEDERFTVASGDGRVLYPVLREEPVRRLLRRLLEIETPRSATMYFLFTGDQPLELDVFAPGRQAVAVVPQPSPQGRRRLLDEWWRHYAGAWRRLRQDPQFPPLVDNFLAANLARRLGLALPDPGGGLFASFAPQRTVWDELFATERHQLVIDQDLLRGPSPSAGELQPLPAPMPWYSLPPVDEASLSTVAVEPIAAHVPAECFYVRFGSFTNYLWFRDLNRKWQNDLGNMIQRRAVERGVNERIEQQLSLRESALAKILGPQVIADVALIGLDPYLNTGSAVGILFQAKANPLLARDLNAQRRQALEKFPAAAETTVRVAERDVSLIATPQGEVRSYYVQDGDFHLVATSLALVQRFLLTGQGERPLAASPGFIGIRRQLPLQRSDDVFAYLPPEFFRELTGPAAWIESQRRVRSVREARLLELAQLQAAAEGARATTREELIEAGLLPEGFGVRPDGSQLVESAAGTADSLRGPVGRFTPLADMAPASATAEEAAAYRAFAERWRQQVGQTPPIAVAVERRPRAGGGETIAIELLAAPLADVKLGRLPDALGDPVAQRVAPLAGDLLRAEFILDAVLPLAAAEQHHLFVGLRDSQPQLVVERGRLAPGAPLADFVRAYIGSWPRPGLIRLLLGEGLAQGAEPQPGPQNTWHARSDDFLVISFKPEMLREVLPQLQMVEAPSHAQARLEVADLSNTQLAEAINAFGYQRARETTVAASRLMNTLINQLHVSAEEARELAERLMGGRFVPPLGGDYELVEVADGRQAWTVSSLAPPNRFLLTAPPEDFTLPLLTWFRGLRGEALLEDDSLAAHVEIDMAASAVP